MAYVAPDPTVPHNSLPYLPPDPNHLESAELNRLLIQTSRQVAELKGSCLRLPDPTLLLNTIILQESKDSSAIENIVTTQDELYQAILTPADTAPHTVKEVLRYREAMYRGLEIMKQKPFVTGQMAISIMQTLRGIDAGYRALPGTKIGNQATGLVVYTPPEPQFLTGLISQWEQFVNNDETYDPLVKLALMHYQFEAIHPFADGNGRTGRILNVLYMIQEGLLTQPVLYISGHIMKSKSDYYRGLQGVTNHADWKTWVAYMLTAIKESAVKGCHFIEQVMALKQQYLEQIRTISQKVPAQDLNELIFSYPYVKVKALVERGLGSRPTATAYLEALAKAGILTKSRYGREYYYINHKLMALLSDED